MNWEPLWALGLAAARSSGQALPAAARYRLAEWLGRGVSRCFPLKRRAVRRNLEIINAWSGGRFRAESVFRNFGITLSDFLSGRPVDVRVEGRERAERARALGRGALFLTTHLGNWEVGGRVLAEWGWPVTAVFLPYRSRTMQAFVQARRAPGLKYLAVGRGAAHGVARALSHGETVAMLADRPFGEDGGEVSLCGRTARFPRGPFLFSARRGVPILPGFVVMDRPGVYRAIVEEPIMPGNGEDAQNLMDKMARLLERYVSDYADQWYCFEPVWEEPGPNPAASRAAAGFPL